MSCPDNNKFIVVIVIQVVSINMRAAAPASPAASYYRHLCRSPAASFAVLFSPGRAQRKHRGCCFCCLLLVMMMMLLMVVYGALLTLRMKAQVA